ncbi:TIGR02221 family CRISPR-associated protein [Halanaerobium congolense]|jgi:CRISPR-associated Csx2 family protein|uniref:CRISPR-associated protein, TM1812 family n=1 Tax=Halanaerobium congolense TaxID=54121 RepID=A0A1G6S7H3_9FIRM|nr:TIGR02221 family CRISPR-associated protein [Halanaerobium congolense]SDD12818.1 CRISPR-associated protein, TM1812 family [Halanaerobium congolense]SHN09731.1 CRISPR-associated protein, TM1812 family [Halanaerobium congolense]
MSKILISPLGVGKLDHDSAKREYLEAKYRFNNKKSSEYKTPFVSAAIAQHLNIDKMILVGTSKSMWEEVYRYFAENSSYELDEDYYYNLVEKIEESGVNNYYLKEKDLHKVDDAINSYLKENTNSQIEASKSKVITYGIDDEEIWSNFDLFMGLTEELEDGDQVYLDITHSFRSIPLFMYLMMDFIQNLKSKQIELSGLYYGMLDIKREMDEDYAPVIDYKPLFEISKWIRGVYDFTNYGNGYLISELSNDKELADRINRVSDLFNINYIKELKTQIRKLNEQLQSTDLKNLKVLNYIVPNLEEFLNRFQDIKSDWEFQLEISKWFYENNKYGNAYISLVESILTYICEFYDLDFTEFNDRMLAKVLVGSKEIRKKYSDLNKLMSLSNKFLKTNIIRRSVAHGSLSETARVSKQDIENYEKYQIEIESLLNSFKLKEEINNIHITELKDYYRY